MLAVQDDWIQYEETPVQRVTVRGGAVCKLRSPAVRGAATRVPSTPRTVVPSAARRPNGSTRVLPPAPTRSAPRARLRLTRRGRVVLVLLPAALALSAAVVGIAGPLAARAAAPAPAPRTVVVGTGDTLWSIAQRLSPEQDPRDVVTALQRANGLDDAVVPAGAVLRLPVAP